LSSKKRESPASGGGESGGLEKTPEGAEKGVVQPAATDSGAPFEVGEIIAGKFRVDRVLGQGGMGVVVLATHLVLEEQFALKLLRPEILEDSETVERFAREAKACVRIKSEHVARVHDVGTREDGTPFMVMEYLEGIDLGTALQETGRLPVEEAVEYIIQACEALAQAHAIGIVHRDIKPENLFIVNHTEGWRSIKLLDFGISKAIPAPMSRNFVPGKVRETRMMGTPHYMSPEQMQQLETIDGRSDIWSLGVVLYELLTAHYAFDGGSVHEVTQAILKGKAPWLDTVRPDAPPGLAQVIERALQKDPEQRFANVAELAIALLPFAPRRARVSAERSASVIRAAGLSSPGMKVPTSIHPPATLRSTGPGQEWTEAAGASSALRPSSIPAISRDPRTRDAPTMPDLSAELARDSAPAKHARAILFLGVGAGLLVVAATLWFVFGHRASPQVREGPPPSSASSAPLVNAAAAGAPSVITGGEACDKNDDCIRRHGGDWICRPSTHVCANLKSTDCQRVVGDATNDDAVIFGSLLPIEGMGATAGIPIEDAIELAIDDFRIAGSIPPAPGKTRRRPIVLVSCNDGAGATAVRAARHLADDLGVAAIIGAGRSGVTTQVATEITIARNVLLISPSSTSLTLTNLADKRGLVWRTCPSDSIQADAHLALMPLIEQERKSRLPAGTNLKVAVLHKGDSYGNGLAEALNPRLSFNGSPALDAANTNYFRRLDYGDPGDPKKMPDYPAVLGQIIPFAPHVIFLLGTGEDSAALLSGIETKWPRSLSYRPIYMMADGSAVAELPQYLAHVPDEARRRILGTKPGTKGKGFAAFKDTYRSRVHDGSSPEAAGAANGYDALYLLAYSVVATGADPITGPNLARGFARQVSGTHVPLGSANIGTAFELLLSGQSFDYDGASGPLDFDLNTGEAASDIQIWCVQTHHGAPTEPRASPVYYSATSRSLVGTMSELRAFCGF